MDIHSVWKISIELDFSKQVVKNESIKNAMNSFIMAVNIFKSQPQRQNNDRQLERQKWKITHA